MDKNKLFLGGFYVLLLSLAALYGWFTTFRLTAERYLEKAESIFNQAVENDMDRREKELGNTYRFVYIPGEEDRAAKVETADTSFFLPKGDIYQHKSRQAKNSDIIQLYLLEENPIRVNKLDSLYRVLLEENDIFAQTALVYITEEETIYSCVDSSFYTSAYKMKEREIGINGEIILRPFVQFKSGCLIAGSPDMYLLIGCFWGIAVALLSWYFFFWRKKTATVSFSEFPSLAVVSASDPYAKLAEELMFDPAAGTLNYKGQEYILINYKLKLFVLLWEQKGRFLSSNALQQALWPDGLCSKDALAQTVRRLRKEVQDISPLRIENVRGKGYRLVITF